MKHINMYASMEIKHATRINQNLFLLFAIQIYIYICININPSPPLCIKQGKYAYIPKYFSPFLSIINKGVKVKTKQINFFSPFLSEIRNQ